jgi:hypothetical protein
VFFQYSIATAGNGYTATADADLDGNGTSQAWGYAKPNAGARVAKKPTSACNQAQLSADNQVGPCDATGAAVMGQSEF